MLEYEKMEIDVIVFAQEDVIAQSCVRVSETITPEMCIGVDSY